MTRAQGCLVSLLSFAAAAAGFQAAHAQQPPDIVTSDSYGNTASGNRALASLQVGGANFEGTSNAAFGDSALESDTTGAFNVAVGASALISNSTGSNNLAMGYLTLGENTSGDNNVALGHETLPVNSTGSNNTAVGVQSLYENVAGNNNTAIGYQALFNNGLWVSGPGENNTAVGYQALLNNSSGIGNVAQGFDALYSNNGDRNVAIGNLALYKNQQGSYNTAIGFDAGYYLDNGNDNMYIANGGVTGESQTLRLGKQGTSGVEGSGILSTHVAGVATSQVTGSAVYINASGQLGVLASSERFKTDVETMGNASERLADLRPVTFKLKSDSTGTVQYGLIAEEVAKVYPELVIRGTDGRVDGVRYEELTPMLLNEVQQLRAKVEDMQDLKQEVAQLKQALATLQTKRAAMR